MIYAVLKECALRGRILGWAGRLEEVSGVLRVHAEHDGDGHAMAAAGLGTEGACSTCTARVGSPPCRCVHRRAKSAQRRLIQRRGRGEKRRKEREKSRARTRADEGIVTVYWVIQSEVSVERVACGDGRDKKSTKAQKRRCLKAQRNAVHSTDSHSPAGCEWIFCFWMTQAPFQLFRRRTKR